MRRTLTVVLALTVVMAVAGTAHAANVTPNPVQPKSVTPEQVIAAFEGNQSRGPQRATLSMSVLRPGQTTKVVMDTISDGQERSLVMVRSPAKLAGQAFLRVGDRLQMYSPAFGKVLPMPPGAQADGFLGSDFSLGDLTSGDFKTKFTVTKLSQDAAGVTLTLTTKPDAPIPYGGVVLRAKAESWQPVSVTYLDQRGQAVKRLTFAAYRVAQGRTYASRIVVDDLVHRGYRTSLETTALKFEQAIPAACFSPSALPVTIQQGC